MVLPFLVQGSRSLIQSGFQKIDAEKIKTNNELFDATLAAARAATTMGSVMTPPPESGSYWAELDADNHIFPVYCFTFVFVKEMITDEETGGKSEAEGSSRITGTCLDQNSRLLQIQEGKVQAGGPAYWVAFPKGCDVNNKNTILCVGTFHGKRFQGKCYLRDSVTTGKDFRSFKWAKPTTVTGCVHKHSADTQCGISFRLSPNGGLEIRRIAEDSLFGKTELEAGMKVVSIQGRTDIEEVNEAVGLIRGSMGDVTIIAMP